MPHKPPQSKMRFTDRSPNFYRNRPKEAAELELEGTIRFTLQERAAQAWEILKEARSSGLPMDQAQELISELVYPPLESDDN